MRQGWPVGFQCNLILATVTREQPRAFQRFHPRHCESFFPRCTSSQTLSLRSIYRPVLFRDGTPIPGRSASDQKSPLSTARVFNDKQVDGQTRAPWHREGSDQPPVAGLNTSEETTKGT